MLLTTAMIVFGAVGAAAGAGTGVGINKYRHNNTNEIGTADQFDGVKESKLFACPTCGHLTSTFCHHCGNCGTDLTSVPVCKNCGHVAGQDEEFCTECGARIPAAAKQYKFCPTCGKQTIPGQKFCVGCGADVTKKKKSDD